MKKFQIPNFLIALALLTTLAVQCGPRQATQVPVVEEKVLKVGILGPFTGPSAATGQQSQNAILMAFWLCWPIAALGPVKGPITPTLRTFSSTTGA